VNSKQQTANGEPFMVGRRDLNTRPPAPKSEVRKRMEAFYAEMSKKPHLMAFLTGMAVDAMGENKEQPEEAPQQPEK